MKYITNDRLNSIKDFCSIVVDGNLTKEKLDKMNDTVIEIVRKSKFKTNYKFVILKYR